MNKQLVKSLVTIIDSLSPEEKELLQLNINNKKVSNISEKAQKNSFNKEAKKQLNFSLDEYIYITRNERIAEQDELIANCFGRNKE